MSTTYIALDLYSNTWILYTFIALDFNRNTKMQDTYIILNSIRIYEYYTHIFF